MKIINYCRIFYLLSLVAFLSCTQDFSNYFMHSGEAFSVKKSTQEWTLMFYMASDNNLESEAIQDINDLETISFNNNNINVITLIDRSDGYDGTNGDWSDTRLYEIVNDTQGENNHIISKELSSNELALVKGNETELDMSDSNTLKRFIQFCYSNYKAEHYALILWGHGSGWRSITTDSFTNTTMSLQDFRNALDLSLGGSNNLDVIAFDTSFGSTIETLWEIKNTASYFVGRPSSINSSGWNYKIVFENFVETDKSVLSFVHSFANEQNTACIDLQSINDVKMSFDNLSEKTASLIDSADKQTLLKNILFSDIQTYHSAQFPSDVFLDLSHFSDVIAHNVALFTDDVSEELAIQHLNTSFQTALSTASVITAGALPIMSVFFIRYIDANIPDSVYPRLYIQGAYNEESILFITEGNSWSPTQSSNITLLDKLFFTVF